MTISFSGLASGIDTSSWIQSLVALKQAKVTTLQQQREDLLTSKDTLSSIRSFFASFRSTIEKITDAKFNIASMNLFAQNIATSAKLNVLTAKATTDAIEGEYKVRVDKIASNTTAKSDYRYLTTIVETTTASKDSKLIDIGVRAGDINVSVGGGVSIAVSITDTDTIGSFIEKLKNIGVTADFNAQTGVFSVNVGELDILDTDNTGIIDALHLEGVNEGYTSNRLVVEKVETLYDAATEDTLLNSLSSGVIITGVQNVRVQNTNGDVYSIEVDADTKLGEFMQALRDAGLNAELNNGNLEISGGKIITGGTYDAVTALGLVTDPYSSHVSGNALTETIIEYELVTYDTRLVDDLGVKEGYLEVTDSEGDTQYLKIHSNQTIGDLMSDLANMGIYSTLDEDNGVLTITGGEFKTLSDTDVQALVDNSTIRETDARYIKGTDLLTALYGQETISVNQTAVSQTYAMSRALSKSSTEVISATEATQLSKFGITNTETVILHKEDGSTFGFDVSGSTTLGGLVNILNNNGVTARLEDGIIHVEGGWMENINLEDALGLEHSTASSYVLGSVQTVTKTENVNIDTKLSELGLGDSTITVHDFDGNEIGTVTTHADMTIGEILNALAGYGISGTIKNGVISLDSDNGNYVTGGVIDDFDIGTDTITFTTSVGVINTSTEVVSATYSITANSSTTLGDLNLGTSTITVKGLDGTTVGTITTAAEMTIGDVLTALAGYGISGTIKDGVINLDSDIGNYATGGVIESFGINTSSATYETTAGGTATSGSSVTFNTTTTSTSFPTVTETITTTHTLVTTGTTAGTETITVTDTIVTNEPTIGSKTLVVTQTVVTTEAVVGTKTITVSQTITTTEPVVGQQTITITHTIECTEAVVTTEQIIVSINPDGTTTVIGGGTIVPGGPTEPGGSPDVGEAPTYEYSTIPYLKTASIMGYNNTIFARNTDVTITLTKADGNTVSRTFAPNTQYLHLIDFLGSYGLSCEINNNTVIVKGTENSGIVGITSSASLGYGAVLNTTSDTITVRADATKYLKSALIKITNSALAEVSAQMTIVKTNGQTISQTFTGTNNAIGFKMFLESQGLYVAQGGGYLAVRGDENCGVERIELTQGNATHYNNSSNLLSQEFAYVTPAVTETYLSTYTIIDQATIRGLSSSQFNSGQGEIILTKKDGSTETISYDSSENYDRVATFFSNNGFKCSISNGVLTLESADACDVVGINVNLAGVTFNGATKKTVTINSQATTYLSSATFYGYDGSILLNGPQTSEGPSYFGISSYGGNIITLEKDDGTCVRLFRTASITMTDAMNFFSNNGLICSLESTKLTVTGGETCGIKGITVEQLTSLSYATNLGKLTSQDIKLAGNVGGSTGSTEPVDPVDPAVTISTYTVVQTATFEASSASQINFVARKGTITLTKTDGTTEELIFDGSEGYDRLFTFLSSNGFNCGYNNKVLTATRTEGCNVANISVTGNPFNFNGVTKTSITVSSAATTYLESATIVGRGSSKLFDKAPYIYVYTDYGHELLETDSFDYNVVISFFNGLGLSCVRDGNNLIITGGESCGVTRIKIVNDSGALYSSDGTQGYMQGQTLKLANNDLSGDDTGGDTGGGTGGGGTYVPGQVITISHVCTEPVVTTSVIVVTTVVEGTSGSGGISGGGEPTVTLTVLNTATFVGHSASDFTAIYTTATITLTKADGSTVTSVFADNTKSSKIMTFLANNGLQCSQNGSTITVTGSEACDISKIEMSVVGVYSENTTFNGYTSKFVTLGSEATTYLSSATLVGYNANDFTAVYTTATITLTKTDGSTVTSVFASNTDTSNVITFLANNGLQCSQNGSTITVTGSEACGISKIEMSVVGNYPEYNALISQDLRYVGGTSGSGGSGGEPIYATVFSSASFYIEDYSFGGSTGDALKPSSSMYTVTITYTTTNGTKYNLGIYNGQTTLEKIIKDFENAGFNVSTTTDYAGDIEGFIVSATAQTENIARVDIKGDTNVLLSMDDHSTTVIQTGTTPVVPEVPDVEITIPDRTITVTLTVPATTTTVVTHLTTFTMPDISTEGGESFPGASFTIAVDSVTATVVTHTTTSTHTIESTTTTTKDHTILQTLTVENTTTTVVTHNMEATVTVENTTTGPVTHTVSMTFTVDTVTTTLVTHTLTATGVIEKITFTITTTTTTATMNTDTKFSQLGMTTTGYMTINSSGVTYTVTVESTDTVNDLLTTLAGYGIAGSVEAGKITLRGDDDAYIIDFSNNIGTALGITGGLNNTYTTLSHTKTANTTSGEQRYSTTNTLTTDDTLRLHGLTANGTITVISDGSEHIVTVKVSDTIDDMLTTLAGLGISGYVTGGQLSLKGDKEAFIKGISANLNAVLKLGSTNYATQEKTIVENTDSKQLTHDVTRVMDNSTLLTDLGITNGNFLITQNGVEYTYALDTSVIKTIGDFRDLLSQYGFNSYIDNDGRLIVTGYGDSYLGSVTDGSNIITQLDLDDWTFGKMTQESDHLIDTSINGTGEINGNTRLTELQDSSGNSLGISTGEYTVVSNGVRTVETITADTTVDDFISTLATYGMVAKVASDGSISVGAQHNSYLATSASGGARTNAIDVLFSEWEFVNIYTSNNIEMPEDVVVSMTRETKLADINEGTYEYGCITIVHDGVRTNLSLTAEDTVGTLMDELALYGFQSVINDSGQLIIKSNGNCTLEEYTGADKKSNVLDLLGVNNSGWIMSDTYTNDEIQSKRINYYDVVADDDTLLSDLDIVWGNDLLKAQGDLALNVDGQNHTIYIKADETIGSLREKFAALGLDATISDGVLMINSGYKELTIDNVNTNSSIVANLGLTYSNDLGGYSASNDTVEQTVSWEEDVVKSVANYADDATLLKSLNITSGSLSVFKNGQREIIDVNADENFAQLRAKVAAKFSDVNIKFEDGYLVFYSDDPSVSVEVGSTTDTSNMAAICGFINDKSGSVKSARELYQVNGDTKIVDVGVFRRGNVSAGTFTIGDAEFTINADTTLNDLITQINASEAANAVATWDSVDGKLVLKSRTTGSSFINIEAGTSNFTDVMGYTLVDTDPTTGAVLAKRLDINTQEVGDNAVFAINGTTYTSTSNTIESDISRITGVTINLKGVSEGEEVLLKVERDKETVSNAVSDIVDAYNELIENVDKEIAKGGTLDDQFSLKMLRNQIRSLMTSSLAGATTFKNLDAIGITFDAATAGDVSTDMINTLTFNKDKFIQAFDADRDALENLLVGTNGIFLQIENTLENSLTANYGYFSSAEKSYNNQISRLDEKIKKANAAVEKYRARLEAKFASMDLLIANMQNQYSSFL